MLFQKMMLEPLISSFERVKKKKKYIYIKVNLIWIKYLNVNNLRRKYKVSKFMTLSGDCLQEWQHRNHKGKYS